MFRILALLLLAALPARAEIAQMSLLPGWRDGGRHVAGLQITLAPGWKTYWRSPGDAGIPPAFNWSGSANLADVKVAWPAPEVFFQAGMRSVGYADGVVLPLLVTPRDGSRPVDLRLSVDIGVCQDVCIPLSASLGGHLPAEAARPDARIRAALSDRALTATEAGAGPLTCRLSPGTSDATIAASVKMPAMGTEEHAVIELADPRTWISVPDLVRNGDTLNVTARIHPPRGAALVLDRASLRLTVVGTRGAVEITGCD